MEYTYLLKINLERFLKQKQHLLLPTTEKLCKLNSFFNFSFFWFLTLETPTKYIYLYFWF